MSTLIEDRRANPACEVQHTWEKLESTYRCRAFVCEESEGGFSAVAARLPGAVGEGDTEGEALDALGEGFRLVLREYLSSGTG